MLFSIVASTANWVLEQKTGDKKRQGKHETDQIIGPCSHM